MLSASAVHALVIDNFVEGAATLGASTEIVAQTGLNSSFVVGGARHVSVTGASTQLTIAPASGLLVSQPSGSGYFTLMYGYNAPLNANFTANGHDRFRFVIDAAGSENAEASMWISINKTLPPRGNAPGPRVVDFRGGGILEIPFSAFSADMSDVDTIAIDVVRMTGGFSLRSVSTAGPPLAGDFNREGVVDSRDLTEYLKMYGRTTANGGSYAGYLSADENRDGRVDGADFLAWQRAVATAPPAGAAVPEPAAATLAAVAGLGFLARRR
ncbi:dockerin type I domain-containing protein [Lacipirellula parvula]|nr:dockerin type I domain-containing protein [Lacipirellula parvula]